MKVTIADNQGEVLRVFGVIEDLPPDDHDADNIDVTDLDDVLVISQIEDEYWQYRGEVEAQVLSLWKAGRR